MQLRTAEPRVGEPDGGRLVGVLALGVPMSRAVLTRVFPSLVPSVHALNALTHSYR
ncbi:hypothetical protein OG871_40435 (plasmid) [Kitasatospora sp. NBC_00374]|uniref:hypothetical protein n=1 Tax=Kitasatospora sp. NBC_00374 TaxID=2975964 RepID=UPI002F917159